MICAPRAAKRSVLWIGRGVSPLMRMAAIRATSGSDNVPLNTNGRRLAVRKRTVFLDMRRDLRAPNSRTSKDKIMIRLSGKWSHSPPIYKALSGKPTRLAKDWIGRSAKLSGEFLACAVTMGCQEYLPSSRLARRRLQMGQVERDYPKMERAPEYGRRRARRCDKNRYFADAKGSPGIVERCATLELNLFLKMAWEILGRGPDALKTSVDGAFSTFEWGGWRDDAHPPHSAVENVAASGSRS